MDAIWKATLDSKYAGVIDQLDTALHASPDDLWEASLWEVRRDHPYVWPVRRIDEKRRTVAPGDEQLLQVYSAFWNIAYHALFHVDFYLSGGVLKGFAPPAPFREDEHRAHVVPNRPYTRAELQDYVAFNRDKAHATIEALTDEQLARPVPRLGVPFADLLLRNLLHTQEHAAQLNLFLGQHGVQPNVAAAVQQGRQILRDGVRGRTDTEIDTFAQSRGGYARLLPRVFTGFCSRIDARETTTVRFDVGDDSFVVRAKPGRATFDKRPPKKADATIAMSPQDFLRLMTGDFDVAAGTADARIKIDGDAAILRRLFAMRPTN